MPGIDKDVIVVSFHLHVGEIQPVVGFDVVLVLGEGALAGGDDLGVELELEVGHGEVGVGDFVIGVVVLQILLVLCYGLLPLARLE